MIEISKRFDAPDVVVEDGKFFVATAIIMILILNYIINKFKLIINIINLFDLNEQHSKPGNDHHLHLSILFIIIS